MKLIHLINRSLVSHPVLFAAPTPKESRLCVLNHLFVTTGTGMAWTPDGYLIDVSGRDPEGNVESEFTWPGGWVATKAPPYGSRMFEIDSLDEAHAIARAHFLAYADDLFSRHSYPGDPPEPRGDRLDGIEVRFYPSGPDISEIPDNVQPDYLEGAYDVAVAALEWYSDLRNLDTHMKRNKQTATDQRISAIDKLTDTVDVLADRMKKAYQLA